jgi:hypothetical protein
MITREDLQNKYAKLSNDELLEIVDNKGSYTELAVLVALEEIGKRNLSEADIKGYKDRQTTAMLGAIKRNVFDDLSLVQKHLFYFVWFPLLNVAFRQNFWDDGYALKLKQSTYYSYCGFMFCLLSIGLSHTILHLSDTAILGFWVAGMIPTYAFDEFFNKKRSIRKLHRLFDKNRRDKTGA